MGTVHEVGHAMYEQGRNEEFSGLPVSSALSLGAHESQSLFWERYVGQSLGLWEFASKAVHEIFPHTSSIPAKEFYRGVNRVMPNCFIRVETDEVRLKKEEGRTSQALFSESCLKTETGTVLCEGDIPASRHPAVRVGERDYGWFNCAGRRSSSLERQI